MQMGFLNSYVDFFYITSHPDGAPSAIEINQKLQQEMGHNKSRKQKFVQTEVSLKELSDILMEGENLHREGMIDQSLEKYREVAHKFEVLNDWGSASYFYKKCLDISMESKSLKGEAQAWLGLGNCEKESFNKYEAMTNFETALQKAQELQEKKLEREISKELVKVY